MEPNALSVVSADEKEARLKALFDVAFAVPKVPCTYTLVKEAIEEANVTIIEGEYSHVGSHNGPSPQGLSGKRQ